MGTKARMTTDAAVKEVTIPAEETQLGRVRDFVVGVCEEANFSERETSNTKLAVDEACTNIIKHAYSHDDETGTIHVLAEIGHGELTIRLKDTGQRFDFGSVQDPDLNQYVETGRKGGLGVFLINRLMDGVEYNATSKGNELVLTKRGEGALAVTALQKAPPLRGTLRYRFTLRAGAGLLVLMLAVWGFNFIRQTRGIRMQRAAKWHDELRVARNLAGGSVNVLLQPDAFSVAQTTLGAELTRLVGGGHEFAWARVVSRGGEIVSSGNIDEILSPYKDPGGTKLPGGGADIHWTRIERGGRAVRDIAVAVHVPDEATGRKLNLGTVHLGVFEDAVQSQIEDNRATTSLIMLGIFALGLLLITGLVRVFVRPIQVLTDGVRAIGDGSFESKLEISGPAEIGAIASVFNEITDKFKRAQNSILEQEKLHKEMEVAKEIQHSLLPRHQPTVSGYDIASLYQAAAEVGGDYYDFVQVDEDTIGVVVADVSGKGVPGSLVMTMIRTALRMEARGNKNASDVMSKMNAFVTDDMKKGMFVTMFYVILDSHNRVISYASAGHNPMILYRHETSETFFLNPRGFPVGISLPDEDLFRKSISLEKIKLKKNDMLLIYTDGVTEAMNERREQYGEDRLIALIKEYGKLSPESFMQRLEADIHKFTAGHAQNDDITVVAVKEKMTADDVLFGIRKKLMDLVEVEGLSVREACTKMRVSPSTYYRYKKRLVELGERGLKNKILREDITLKRLSIEARKRIIEIIAEHPEYGARRLTEEFNADRDDPHRVTERMVYDELRRLNLNTRELRIDYLRRNRLSPAEEGVGDLREKTSDLIDGLIDGIPGVGMDDHRAAAPEGSTPDGAGRSVVPGVPEPGSGSQEGAGDVLFRPADETFDDVDGVRISLTHHDGGIVELSVAGHLDSVTSAALERRLRDVVSRGMTRVVVNLADASYISSGGWGIFTGEVRSLRQSGGDIVLASMMPEVYDVYELLGFADVLRSFPSVDDALAFLSLPVDERRRQAPADAETGDSFLSGIDEEAGVDSPTIDGPVDFVGGWESLNIEATTVGEEGNIAVLSLRGVVDTVSAERLREALARVIKSGIHRVVVDMAQVEYVSSGGWGTFTERLRELRRAGGDIKLFGMDPDVYYVFTMLGFNIVLSSFDILVDAIDDFKNAPSESAPIEPDGAIPDDVVITPRRSYEADERENGPVIDLGAAPFAPAGRTDIVDWTVDGDVAIAAVHGAIEAVAADAISQSFEQVLAQKPANVVFDLSDVDYISSTGWGRFAAAQDAVSAWDGRVALCGMSASLHEIYSCLEFRTFIGAWPDAAAAVAGLRLVRDAGRSGGPGMADSGVGANRGAPPPVDARPGAPGTANPPRVPGKIPVTDANPIPDTTDQGEDVDSLLNVDLSDEPARRPSPPPAGAIWPGTDRMPPDDRPPAIDRAVPPDDLSDEPARRPSPPPAGAIWPGTDRMPPDDRPPAIDRAVPPDDRPPAIDRSAPSGDSVAPPEPESISPVPADLNVDDSTDEGDVERDRALRDLGWNEYGERLRNHRKARRRDE